MNDCYSSYCIKAFDDDKQSEQQLQQLFSRIKRVTENAETLDCLITEFLPTANLKELKKHIDLSGKIVWISDLPKGSLSLEMDIISEHEPAGVLWLAILKLCGYSSLRMYYTSCNRARGLYINTDSTGSIFPWKYDLYVRYSYYDSHILTDTIESHCRSAEEVHILLQKVIDRILVTFKHRPGLFPPSGILSLAALTPKASLSDKVTAIQDTFYTLDNTECSISRYISTIRTDTECFKALLKDNLF